MELISNRNTHQHTTLLHWLNSWKTRSNEGSTFWNFEMHRKKNMGKHERDWQYEIHQNPKSTMLIQQLVNLLLHLLQMSLLDSCMPGSPPNKHLVSTSQISDQGTYSRLTALGRKACPGKTRRLRMCWPVMLRCFCPRNFLEYVWAICLSQNWSLPSILINFMRPQITIT